jgi:hypothetical protein
MEIIVMVITAQEPYMLRRSLGSLAYFFCWVSRYALALKIKVAKKEKV